MPDTIVCKEKLLRIHRGTFICDNCGTDKNLEINGAGDQPTRYPWQCVALRGSRPVTIPLLHRWNDHRWTKVIHSMIWARDSDFKNSGVCQLDDILLITPRSSQLHSTWERGHLRWSTQFGQCMEISLIHGKEPRAWSECDKEAFRKIGTVVVMKRDIITRNQPRRIGTASLNHCLGLAAFGYDLQGQEP
jgi:hypothetical protein